MIGIIVVFPNQKDAVNIRNLLMRNGHQVLAVCTTGASAIQAIDQMEGSDGILISGLRFSDMTYSDLLAALPDTWQMAVMASRMNLERVYERKVIKIVMPVKAYDLFMTLEALENTLYRQRKRRKQKPKERSSADRALIENAKSLLMSAKNMTEEEAHRYIQKSSMDSGNSMTETCQMLIRLYSQTEENY